MKVKTTFRVERHGLNVGVSKPAHGRPTFCSNRASWKFLVHLETLIGSGVFNWGQRSALCRTAALQEQI